MSLPTNAEPLWRPFHGWSLPHYLIDGGFSMLLTLIGSKLLDFSPLEAVLLGGLSLITVTGVLMLWVGRHSNVFDLGEFQSRDQGFEIIRQADQVTSIVSWIGQYMGLCPMDLSHQDHTTRFLQWREVVSSFLTAVANEKIVREFRTHCDPEIPVRAQTFLFGLQATFSRRDLRETPVPAIPPATPSTPQLLHSQ